MTGAEVWTIALVALAVVVGIVRLTLWRRAIGSAAQGPLWRTATLIAVQGLAGLLLCLTLFPPKVATPPGRLIIATRGATAPATLQSGDILVALPEAGPLKGATRAPDLAGALSRFPEAGRVRIQGEGLIPRDQAPLDRIVEVALTPPSRGLISLTLPPAAAPGAVVSVGGQVGSLPAGVVELIDPANAVMDRAPVTARARFSLSANTRAPGQTLFSLRLRDAAGRIVEQVAIPVDTRAQRPPRVLVLAGAPGPETKYLKRWAQDGGVDLGVQIEVGAGVQMGDPPVRLNPETLEKIDLVVIDDRRWDSLDAGERAALEAATRAGLGLLLRPTGPLSEVTRREWAGLGVAVSGGDDARALRLEGDLTLNRRDLTQAGPSAISMIRDSDGVALASWRGRGRGRIGLWTVTDSYVLMLAGQADRYGDLWSELFSVLARPGEAGGAQLEGLARRGERASLCHLGSAARIVGPDGAERAALIDPATGERACAAYWPDQSGWHLVRDGARAQSAFYVHPADAAPSLRQAANRDATLALAQAAPAKARQAGRRAPGSPWPWAAALLATLGALWWLERRGITPSATLRAK